MTLKPCLGPSGIPPRLSDNPGPALRPQPSLLCSAEASPALHSHDPRGLLWGHHGDPGAEGAARPGARAFVCPAQRPPARCSGAGPGGQQGGRNGPALQGAQQGWVRGVGPLALLDGLPTAGSLGGLLHPTLPRPEQAAVGLTCLKGGHSGAPWRSCWFFLQVGHQERWSSSQDLAGRGRRREQPQRRRLGAPDLQGPK